MIEVIVGENIELSRSYVDSSGDPVDPDSVRLDIMRSYSTVVFGPFIDEDLDNPTVGTYSYTLSIPTTLTPGIYSAKWSTEIEGDPNVYYETFQVSDPPVEANGLLDQPRRYGVIRESPLYRDLGIGTTDRIFLIGHADGVNLNDPIEVNNLQNVINMLGADADSPLLKALLECYNTGARDIWVVAAAPMSEYVENLSERFDTRSEWGDLNFYERYYERLETTYSILEEYDLVEIIVPLEAPFYDAGDVDFLTQLTDHCTDSFSTTGSPRVGVIGTRIEEWTTDDITAMAEDSRLSDINNKFTMVVVGEGIVAAHQMPFAYRTSLATSAAAVMSTLPLNRGLTYQRLPRIVSIVGRDLKKSEIDTLCNSKLNPGIRTQKGKRGTPFQICLTTDNTLSEDGSDYWSGVQMRLIAKVLNDVRALGKRTIGTIGFPIFKQEVDEYLTNLVHANVVRGYEASIQKEANDQTRAVVDISLKPMFGVREIFFTVEVGPGV